MQKVLLDRSYVLGFNLAIIVLIIELFIYLLEVLDQVPEQQQVQRLQEELLLAE